MHIEWTFYIWDLDKGHDFANIFHTDTKVSCYQCAHQYEVENVKCIHHNNM